MKKIILIFTCICFVTLVFGQEKRKMRIVENENGKKIEMELENGNVTLLKVDGQTLPKEKYNDYKNLVEKVQAEMKQPVSSDEKTQTIEHVFEQTILTKKEGDNTTLIIENNMAEPVKLVIGKDGTVQYMGETLKDGAKIKFVSDKKVKIINDDELNVEKLIIKKEGGDKKEEKEVRKKITLQDDKNLSTVTEMSENDDEWLDDELLKDKIIDKKGTFAFLFTDEAMTVNGKQQPKNIFEKYKKLFEQKGMKFNKNTKIEINKTTH
jgi:hypothetical protein